MTARAGGWSVGGSGGSHRRPKDQGAAQPTSGCPRAQVLSAEDKKAIGTIRRYGVAADVIIMVGGLAEALRDEDARGAKSFLAKAKGSLDEVIGVCRGGGLR